VFFTDFETFIKKKMSCLFLEKRTAPEKGVFYLAFSAAACPAILPVVVA